MARTETQKPAVDYFSLLTQKYQKGDSFESNPAAYDLSLTPPESCDEIPPSPVSPSLDYPPYDRSKTQDKSDQVFNFGSFDDWMGWDEPDPADNALSPTSDFFPELKEEPRSPKISAFHQRSNSNSRGITPARIQQDTSSLFRSPSISEEPLFQSPSALFSPPITDPPQNLYSTPLSWSTPSASLATRPFTRLSPQEESQLRAIAMPSLSLNTSQSNPTQQTYSPSSGSSPEPPSRFENRRKRKSSVEDDEDDDMSDSGLRNGKPVKKTAHNMIEKRYRTNLNDKIAALRDSVPSLRVVSKGRDNNGGKEEDLQGLTPAHKLNKATVLSKATEYIAHLEKRNKAMQKENAVLKSRVEAFEILMQNRQAQSQQRANNSRQAQQPYGFDRILS
ncbi:helix-loop-helix DNA-binding domain-containing protein [Bisporella sp. PMI_857]|nr:helix-loop-helix DNA-binding domain-containing protein [Bisporella sp. PMI_857]